MNYSEKTIAAAIATITDRAIQEGGVKATDSDAMATIMAQAEEMVANQLARSGMALQEALATAGRAAMAIGRESPESEALADDAFRNRNMGAPAPAAAPVADPVDAIAPAEDDAQVEAGRAAPTAPARVAASAPARPAARQAPQPRRIAYEMTTRKVHEIFSGIQANDPDFDFDLPFVNWAERHGGVPKLDPAYTFDISALHTVLYAIATGVSLNIVGPHGCGKTQIVHQVAARLNFPVTTLPMDGQISRRELIGQEKLRATDGGNESYFSEGLLPKALAEPGFILFDEVDRGVSDLQYACHSVYLQDGLTILEDAGRFVPFHPQNRVFATANTKGRGSVDGMYQPPEEMSEATRDRWSLWLDMDYPDAESDAGILLNKTPGLLAEHAQAIAGIAAQIRSAYKQGRLSQTCSMRQQLDVARMTVFMCQREKDDVRRKKGLRLAFDRVIGGRASPEDKGAIETYVQTKIPEAFTGDPIF